MGHSPNLLFQACTVLATGGIGGVALFTATAGPHTLAKNQIIQLGGGAAPGGLTQFINYWVAADQNFSDTTFAISATPSGPPLAASSAGTTVTFGPPSGTYRVIRIHRFVEEQIFYGAGSASAAKIAAKNPVIGSGVAGAYGNQNQLWKRRSIYQFMGNPTANVPYEDEFEYIVSAVDDGT